jgi:GNAT superfamily N-acetyltransferase
MWTFRPLTVADFDRLEAWFAAPHARASYGHDRAGIEERYLPALRGEEVVFPFIAAWQGEEVGLVEWGKFGDFPEMARLYRVDDPLAANCDILIGEVAHAHRGLGAGLVRSFLAQHAFADASVTSVIIDPHPTNPIAIRSYEKAGFRFLRTVPDDGEGRGLYLMELPRARFESGVVADGPLVLRPARAHELPLLAAIDDDASATFIEFGLALQIDEASPFAQYERDTWTAALADQRVLVADWEGTSVGFIALGHVDRRPFVHQLSVHRDAQRRGIGAALLERAKHWAAREGELWLTTWEHVPWNGPWYEKHGFERVPSEASGPELRAVSAREQALLPAPERRGVWRWRRSTEG